MMSVSVAAVTPRARRCASSSVVAKRECVAQPRQIALQRRDVRPNWSADASPASVSSAARIFGALACASMVSRASVSASSASRSSTRRKCGDSDASSGKRRSSDWQKAWIVPMRMPPGRSSTRANSARAAVSIGFRWFDAQRVQFPRQRRVVERDPLAERLLQPHRHLGGGGLGEGEALDALGRRAGQHQAQQPIGQQLGLARSGRGADEGGDRRIGGLELFRVGAVARRRPLPDPSRKGRGDSNYSPSPWEGVGGGPATTHSSPAAAHSATRASWA